MQTNEWVSLLVATILVGYVGIRILNTKERLAPFNETVKRDETIFKTGDLLLFHSNAWLMFLLDSPYSHVGIIVVLNETPYVFEIVPHHSVPTLMSVNRLDLDRDIYYRPIQTALDREIVLDHLCNEADQLYDFAVWYPLVKEVFDHVVFPRLPCRKLQGVSCATLVGRLLQKFGVMVHKDHFVPEDFSSLRYEGRWGCEQRLV